MEVQSGKLQGWARRSTKGTNKGKKWGSVIGRIQDSRMEERYVMKKDESGGYRR